VLKKDIETGFDLFSDVVLHPSFHADELSRRKTQLSGALKQKEEDPSYVAGKAFAKTIYGKFPYARPVEGSVESIATINRDDTVRFYDHYYRPDNALLVVVGDLSRDELLKLANRYFAAWKASAKKEATVVPAEDTRPALSQPRTTVIEKDVTQASIVMGHRGISRSNPDYYAVQLMNYILGGGGFSSRLMKIIRDDLGLTYGIHSSFSANLYPGAFEVEVQTKSESAGQVIAETLKQIRRIRAEGVTDEELRDAKDFMIGSFPRRIETSRKIADFLTAVQFYNLGDDYIDKYKDYINKVTKEDVLRAARKYLNEQDIEIVVVGNKKKLKL
jgi:zinc protease